MDPEWPGSRAILAGQICPSHGRAFCEGLGTETLDATCVIAIFTGNDLNLVFCSADLVLCQEVHHWLLGIRLYSAALVLCYYKWLKILK